MKTYVLPVLGMVVLVASALLASVLLIPNEKQLEGPATMTQSQVDAGVIKADAEHNAMISELIRQLGDAQDGIALGVDGAVEQQEGLFDKLAEAFAKIDDADWRSAPDVSDIILYALSGGEPDVIYRFVESAPKEISDDPLVRGIAHYVTRQPDKAKDDLSKVSLWQVDPLLVGPLAIAKAALHVQTDQSTALTALDAARLAGPNSAIEEAALRRQASLLLSQERFDEALQAVAQYVARFGTSSYAEGFFVAFAKTLSKSQADDLVAIVVRVLEATEDTRAEVRAELMLALSQAAVKQGQLRAAQKAAEPVLEWSASLPEQKARATLYIAVACAPTERAQEAKALFESLAEDHFSGDDVELLKAARRIASIVSGATSSTSDVQRGPPEPAAVGEIADTQGTQSSLSKAKEALSKTKELLEGGNQL